MTNDRNHDDRIGGIRLERRGEKGTYHASFWREGTHHRKSLRTSNKRQAERQAVKLANDLQQGNVTPHLASDCLIEECREQFITFKRDDGKGDGTIRRYAQVLRDFAGFVEGLGVRKMSQLKIKHLDLFITHLKAKPRRK